MKKILLKGLTAMALVATTAHAENLVVTSEIPITTNPSPSIEKFLKLIKERSDGKITGNHYAASQLYNDRDALGAIGTGAVQMVWPVASRLEQIDERLGIISLPFTLGTEEFTNQCFVDQFADDMSKFIEPKGMKILGFARTAELAFVMRNKNVINAEDLKDQKIRAIGGKVMLDSLKQVGASPVSMAASEMSAALAQGAIDGALTSPAGWHDVLGSSAKHTTLVSGLNLATSPVVVDKLWYDGLSEELKSVFDETLAEVLKAQWVETIEKDKELIAAMVEKGGTYHEMVPEQVQIIKERFASVSEGFKSKHPELFERIEEIKKSCF
ncbi:MAG: TRAP transporter substrate-binding protein DctP [Alcaligenaceae bacterium]|nr:TRAP transporter substrate-binding protein DctP [Alcaligenaceae bacterium]